MPKIQINLVTGANQQLNLSAEDLDHSSADVLITRLFDLATISEQGFMPKPVQSNPQDIANKLVAKAREEVAKAKVEEKPKPILAPVPAAKDTEQPKKKCPFDEDPNYVPPAFIPPKKMETTLYTPLAEVNPELAKLKDQLESKPSPDHKYTDEEFGALLEKDKELNVDYQFTGIKHKLGIPHYRCRYNCPNCGLKSNHFIKRSFTFVKCHNCQTQMNVREATKVGFPNRDDFGNFYIAD